MNKRELDGACVPAILEWRGCSLTVNAHFDGKVIVPDEPLDLRPNQALILHAVDSDALPEDLADRHDHYLYGRSSGNEQQ